MVEHAHLEVQNPTRQVASSWIGKSLSGQKPSSFRHDVVRAEGAYTGWDFSRVPVQAKTHQGQRPSLTNLSMQPWRPGDPMPRSVNAVLQSPGYSISLPEFPHVPNDLSFIRIHTGDMAAEAAMALNAEAFNVGMHIVFGPQGFQPHTIQGRRLIAHELAHALQRSGDQAVDAKTTFDQPDLERDARTAQPQKMAARGLLRSPASKVLKWAEKWLSKRTAKYVSKHIADHMRVIATKSIHTVFRNPREVKYLLKTTVAEAAEMTARKASSAAVDVIEEGAIRVSKQLTSTPGKPWWVIEKTFSKAIGNQGQRVLRIVVNHAGKIVTAFPTDALKILGVGVGAGVINAFSERTAEAAEALETSSRRQESLRIAMEAAQNDDGFLEWVPFIGDIWGGSLNAGEDQMLALQREKAANEKMVRDVVKATVADIENERQQSLGPSDIAQIDDFVRMVVTSGQDIGAQEAAPVD